MKDRANLEVTGRTSGREKVESNSSSSIANRLVIGFGSFFIILTIASSGVLFGIMQARLQNERTQVLRDRLGAVISLLKSPAHGLESLRDRVTKEWPTRGGEKVFVQITDGNSHLVTQSPLIPSAVFEAIQKSKISKSTDSHPYLAIVRDSDNSLGLTEPVHIAIAVDDEQSSEFLSSLRETLLTVSVLNLCISLFAGWWIVRLELRPLEVIAQKISGINSRNLHERIELFDLPKELRVLTKAFNRTLDRLEDSFERMSRFSSNIAHELRTPIANILGTFEVVLSRSRSGDEYTNAIESGLEETSRLKMITESLLFLARSEDTARQLTKSSIHIRSELERVLDFLEASANERGIRLELDPQSNFDFNIEAEPVLFQRVLVNILENAIRYTNSGGRINIFCTRHEKLIFLKIQDDGIGIPEESLPFIFERFYRVDPSRSSKSGGVGLGLAIVKSIVELHAGEIQVRSQIGQGTEVEIRWPQASY